MTLNAKKSHFKKIGFLNLLSFLMLVLSWGAVFCVGGMAGAILWAVIKFI